MSFPGLLLGIFALALAGARAVGFEARGTQFLGFSQFSEFSRSPVGQSGEWTLTSPEIRTDLRWDQLVASWNVAMSKDAWMRIEVRAFYLERPTKYYTMALYSGDPARHPRQSVPNQRDADGDVATDTLVLKAPCQRLQLRLTMGGEAQPPPVLKFFGLSLTDSQAVPSALPPNRAAWGKTIAVPERSQMVYSNGLALCSPTTVSMILGYWSRELRRPELDCDVPEVAQAVNDPAWQGTGNWAFNTAFAGSYPGLRAYVARLADLAEVEDWIAGGFPVGLSVCLNQLRGRSGPASGHLVVCVGFTNDGDPILNDPGTRLNVRKVFPRKNVIAAWANSRNTVYLK
jgi:hypothetical protein